MTLFSELMETPYKVFIVFGDFRGRRPPGLKKSKIGASGNSALSAFSGFLSLSLGPKCPARRDRGHAFRYKALMSIRIKSVQHIAVATKSVEPVLSLLKDLFGFEAEHEEIVEKQKVSTHFLKIAGVPFEFLAPTQSDSPISKFLEKRGNAFHHLALEVESLDEAVRVLKEKNIRLINEEPQEGAQHTRTVFLHPKATEGLLIELVEKDS